jgi:hypothetical protein
MATKGKVSQALPIFKKVFLADKNWIELLKRLPKTGMIPNNKRGRALLERILNEATKP